MNPKNPQLRCEDARARSRNSYQLAIAGQGGRFKRRELARQFSMSLLEGRWFELSEAGRPRERAGACARGAAPLGAAHSKEYPTAGESMIEQSWSQSTKKRTRRRRLYRAVLRREDGPLSESIRPRICEAGQRHTEKREEQ